MATDETSSHVDEPQQSLIDLAAAAETVEREKEDIDHGDTTEVRFSSVQILLAGISVISI